MQKKDDKTLAKNELENQFNACIEAFSNTLMDKIHGRPEEKEFVDSLGTYLNYIQTNIKGSRRTILTGLLYVTAHALRQSQPIPGLPGDCYQEMVYFLENIPKLPEADRILIFANPQIKNLIYYAFFRAATPALWNYLGRCIAPVDLVFLHFLRPIFVNIQIDETPRSSNGYDKLQAHLLNGNQMSDSQFINSIMEIARTCHYIAKNPAQFHDPQADYQQVLNMFNRSASFIVLYGDGFIFESWIKSIYESLPNTVIQSIYDPEMLRRLAMQLAMPSITKSQFTRVLTSLAHHNFGVALENTGQAQQLFSLLGDLVRHQNTHQLDNSNFKKVKEFIDSLVSRYVAQLKTNIPLITTREDLGQLSLILLQNLALVEIIKPLLLKELASSSYHLLKLTFKNQDFKNADLIARAVIKNPAIFPRALNSLAELILATIQMRAAINTDSIALPYQPAVQIAIDQIDRIINRRSPPAKKNETPKPAEVPHSAPVVSSAPTFFNRDGVVPAPTVLEISELNYPITRHRIINNPQLLTKILRGALANPLSTFPALVNVFNKPWLPAWRQSERNGYSVAYDLFKLVDEFGIKAVLNLRDMYGAPVINCVLNIPSEMYDTLVADVVNIPLISPHGSLCLLLILASDKYKTPLVIESFFNKHPVYLQVSDYYRYSYEQYVGKGTLPVIDSQVSANKILGMIITRINQTDSNNPQVHKQTVAWVVAVLRAASRYLTLEDILARPDKIALMSTFLGLQPDTVLAIAKAVDNYVGDYKGPHPTTLVKIAPFSLFMIAASALSLENGTTNAIHLFGTYTRFEANMLHYLTQAVYRGPLPQPIATLISSQEGFIASWIEDAILGYSQKTHLKM